MPNRHTLLIAEDSAVNRQILTRILSDEYTIVEAENGKQALEVLSEKAQETAAVILDLGMPVMDGFEVLNVVRQHEEYLNIPIIVETGNVDDGNETKALSLGAWDFVKKPYEPDIIRFRLRNAVERSKLNLIEKLRYQTEHDTLTGLYNKRKFYTAARQLIDSDRESKYVCIRFDISRFRQFNSLYGTEAGDEFLKYIASLMPVYSKRSKGCVYAHIEGDIFAVCGKYDNKSEIIEILKEHQNQLKRYITQFNILVIYGIYFLDDLDVPVREMLDRASLAAKNCKKTYSTNIAEYTDEMFKVQQNEQEITSQMNIALDSRQFCVYYQPKYNIATETPYGAEALVRWKHPERGLIPPGAFIPVFEKNGFIAKVDYYVWKCVCEDLKQWSDNGLKPNPVSVNISRVNLNNPHIVDILTSLVNEYGIEPKMLQLEITETAYMDNPDLMKNVVQNLHDKGFTVLMDDFGSGFSSLNTLKEISVDILKIDMKFLPTGENNTKSEKILTSMIRMADWLGMPVVVEGVETETQKNFLLSVGCNYVQGYYYGKPMPKEAYEELISSPHKGTVVKLAQKSDRGSLDAVLSSDPKTEALLESLSVPVAIYDCSNEKIDRIRANQSFYDSFGYRNTPGALCITDNEKDRIASKLRKELSTMHTVETEINMTLSGGGTKWYRVSFRYVTSGINGQVMCAVYSEIAEEKKYRSELDRIAGILNRSSEKRSTMLIVDDSDVSRVLLKGLFENDFNVIEAASGREALDLLSVHKDETAIILLDLMMPGMDGSEFLTSKNTLDGACDIPIIVISSDQRTSIQRDMLKNGVNDYVIKPFVPELIYRRVMNVLEYQSRFSELLGEFRKSISLSPDIGNKLNRAYLTVNEVKSVVSFLSPIFDVIRVVDPDNTSVLTFDDDNNVIRNPYSCFKVWKKETRCENCSSACAMHSGCQMTKYEFIENDIFYVVSKPIEIILEDNTSLKVIMEIVSHVSDSLMSQEFNGVPIRRIMETTRQKIYCDVLTGAYNRRYLYEMLFLHHSRSDLAKSIAVIMMDMNNFKGINDTFGHATGDYILSEATKALQSCIRKSDSVVRYGGDEFVIILTDCTEALAKEKISEFDELVGKIAYGPDNSLYAKAKFGLSFAEEFMPTRHCLDKMISDADGNMYLNNKK